MLDVCLLADGAYPYATGGTAAWIDQLVRGLETTSFGIVHVATARDLPHESSYPIPANVERLVEAYPLEAGEAGAGRAAAHGPRGPSGRVRRDAFGKLEAFFERLLVSGDLDGAEEALDLAGGGGAAGLTADDVLGSREAFDVFVRLYEAHADGQPYLETFRMARAVLAPVVRTLRTPTPPARVYHAISTGYAGLLGALAAGRAGVPLIVTEPADPADERPFPGLDRSTHEAVRGLLRRAVYRKASAILTFTDAALQVEVRRGAPEERCRVVPDGLDLPRFAGLRASGSPTSEKATVTVALVAPVIPEKDVKTFLRAAKLLVERLDLVELIVVGRSDLNLAYHRECLLQAQMLGIDRMVRFMGPLDTRELLTHLDCLVLTSVSEGAPLALLEAMAAGVPSVATDTGGCRELLEGRRPEDRALGASGIVAPVGDHEAVAAAVLRCVRDHALRGRLVAAGQARVERFYRRDVMHGFYRELYERLSDRRRAAALAPVAELIVTTVRDGG